MSTAYAISFALFGVKSYVSRSGTPLQPPFAYARLPQFPVTPVIPVVPFGWCLNRAANARPLAPDAPLISAAVEFLQWIVSSPAAGAVLNPAIFFVPILADAARQAAFWSQSDMDQLGQGTSR